MNITNKLRAGYPGIYIVTHEEQRAEKALVQTAKELKWKIFGWTVADGRFDITTGETFAEDQLEVLEKLESLDEKTILVLKDYHLILNEPNPLIYRKLKNALFHAKTTNKCIVILAPVLVLPVDLQKLISVIDLPLPDRDQLKDVLEGICKGNEKKMPKSDELLAALDAAKGLTTSEAEDAFSLAIVEKGKADPIIIAREKCEIIRKNGIVTLDETPASLDDLGGWDIAKAWLLRRKNAFGEEAKKYNLPMPKGVLIFGIQGTGKDIFAMACSAALGIPRLKLNPGDIFGKHVGESEQNLNRVIDTCEAVAPCVLHISEMEKGFGRNGDGGESDGGTQQRVFARLLDWTASKKTPVFIVATANEVRKLDPALVRKGRFDEIFFVDLPSAEERHAIWKIQVEKYGRDAESLFTASEYSDLVKISTGWTGAEIESSFRDSLYTGFDHGREPTMLDIVEQSEDFYPLSKLMAEDVKALRDWGKGRARPVSTISEQTKAQRKLA